MVNTDILFCAQQHICASLSHFPSQGSPPKALERNLALQESVRYALVGLPQEGKTSKLFSPLCVETLLHS